MDYQVSRLRLLGLFFCLAGGAAITFGWAGTAQVTCVDCQVPYLISGGAGGVALAIVGTGLLLIAQLRVEGNRIAQRLAPPPADREADPDAPGGPTKPARPATGLAPPEQARTEPLQPLTIADRSAR